MYDVEKIYYYFRKAQSSYRGSGFRMPKNFENHFNKRMTSLTRESLRKITRYFNTKWNNIDPYNYFLCGFEIYKSFSYNKFFDEKVLNLYIRRSNIAKREMEVNKKRIEKSVSFISLYMKKIEVKTLIGFCNKIDGKGNHTIINLYIKDKIDKFTVCWLIMKGYLKLNDNDMAVIPYISEQYRNIVYILQEINDFIENLFTKKGLIGGK